MYVIEEQKWNQVNVHTWEDLSPHLWECFRLALMETETEQEVQGVVLEYSKAFNEVITELKGQGVRVEFSPIVASTITEMIVNIVVSNRDYKSSMLDYLPLYERKSRVFDNILGVYDKEFRRLEQILEIIKRNMFVGTAVESLHLHERDLGIKSIDSLKYDQRREQVSSRYRASFDQTTEATIKDVAGAYSNGEVEVNLTDIDGLYEIKFIGTKGVPNNLSGLKEALDIIMPAHLGLTYKYTFTPWEELGLKVWGDCAAKTWNDLRVWEGVI